MEKSIIVTIMVDDVKLSDIETLSEALEKLLEDYEHKRVNLTIQDEKLVSFR
jgi:hypothetical protein